MRLQREDGLLVDARVEVLDDAVLRARREVVGVVRVPRYALDVGGQAPVAHRVGCAHVEGEDLAVEAGGEQHARVDGVPRQRLHLVGVVAHALRRAREVAIDVP